MYDLIVIGSGPAGSSAAITAARSGARTLLVERGRFPRNKVCGEFVSAESLELLSWLLGSSGSALLAAAHRIAEVRICSDGLVLTSPLNPPAASIARFDLDAALWEASRASGVEAREQSTVTAISGEGPFTVVTQEGTFESRSAINASGRSSNLTAAGQRNDKTRHKWLGVKALMPFVANKTSLENAGQSYRQTYESELGPVFGTSSRLRQIFFLLPRVVRISLFAGLKRGPALVQYLVHRTR